MRKRGRIFPLFSAIMTQLNRSAITRDKLSAICSGLSTVLFAKIRILLEKQAKVIQMQLLNLNRSCPEISLPSGNGCDSLCWRILNCNFEEPDQNESQIPLRGCFIDDRVLKLCALGSLLLHPISQSQQTVHYVGPEDRAGWPKHRDRLEAPTARTPSNPNNRVVGQPWPSTARRGAALH